MKINAPPSCHSLAINPTTSRPISRGLSQGMDPSLLAGRRALRRFRWKVMSQSRLTCIMYTRWLEDAQILEQMNHLSRSRLSRSFFTWSILSERLQLYEYILSLRRTVRLLGDAVSIRSIFPIHARHVKLRTTIHRRNFGVAVG